MQIRRSDDWRLCYDARRYLAHLSNEELTNRARDILTNLTILTAAGKIGVTMPVEGQQFPWIEIWTHTLEEFALRGMELPAKCIDPSIMPKPTAPIPAKGSMESKGRAGSLTNALMKYGNKEWLAKTLATGEWLISPASYYSDPALGHARYDSELEFSVYLQTFEPTMKPVPVIEGRYYDTLKDVHIWSTRAGSDYYLVSLARGLIYRMFDDFHSDSCMIIHDEVEFRQRMLRAFEKAKPGWWGNYRTVDYIDPCLPKNAPDIYFAKHFKYAYQEEFRFVWTPWYPITQLSRFTVDLGPLGDICEIFALDEELYRPEKSTSRDPK